MATTNNNDNKLPLAHPTKVTWIAVATVAAIVVLYILWAVFLAQPTIMR